MNLTVYEGGLISASDADALVPQSQKGGAYIKVFYRKYQVTNVY